MASFWASTSASKDEKRCANRQTTGGPPARNAWTCLVVSDLLPQLRPPGVQRSDALNSIGIPVDG